MKSYAAIILAAGASRRLRTFKPLLPINGETFIDRLVSIFLTNSIEVYVVVGHRAEELKAAIKNRNIICVENPEYKLGMFTSVQAGVFALTSNHTAFFIMPVDIPLIRLSTIRQLLSASAQHPGKIIYPIFHKKRGHPPLIPMKLARIIKGWSKDGNLREILSSFEHLAVEVMVSDRNILLDIDTAEDYKTIIKRLHLKT